MYHTSKDTMSPSAKHCDEDSTLFAIQVKSWPWTVWSTRDVRPAFRFLDIGIRKVLN
jgi:hypothetical protein